MNLRIPEDLKKYCSLSEDESIIDCFICPVEGCKFSTRLGPGAIRMHILLRADPSATVYTPSHQDFHEAHQTDLTLDSVSVLADIPFRSLAYKEDI